MASTDPTSRSRGAIVATTVLAVAIVAVVIVATAPANWLAHWIAARTGDTFRLADAEGTVWSGSAVVAVAAAAASSSGTPERLALPGRVTWRVEWTHPLAPVLHLTHDGVLDAPVSIRRTGGVVVVDAGTATVPASLLRLVGAPLNSLAPEGRCTLRWDRLAIDDRGIATGEGTLAVGGLVLAISPVRPLGDYLVNWSGDAHGLTWRLATSRGPLALEGNGRVAGTRSQAHVVVRASADAPSATVAQLGPLLDVIGRRSPNEAVIDVGAS